MGAEGSGGERFATIRTLDEDAYLRGQTARDGSLHTLLDGTRCKVICVSAAGKIPTDTDPSLRYVTDCSEVAKIMATFSKDLATSAHALVGVTGETNRLAEENARLRRHLVKIGFPTTN